MKHRSKKHWLLPLTALLMLSACQQQADDEASAAGAASQPIPVDIVTLEPQQISLSSALPARTVAHRMAEVRPQVSGIIEKRLFEEGSTVKEGQTLYKIEPALYEAQLANAQAQLVRAQAVLKTAKSTEARYKDLLEDNAISRQEYDDALGVYLQAQADINVQQAAIKTAKTNLGYTNVTAPISGHIGISNVTEGALVTAQQSEMLTTIHQLDPIYIDISQPSKELLELRKRIIAKEINAEKAPTVTLQLEDDSVYPLKGELKFAEVNVNPMTGDVVLRAVMPNPDQLLLPGMFVRAIVSEGEVDNAILVPQRGVTFDRSGQGTAMVVTSDNKVEARSVKVDRAIDGNWLIDEGLNAGDKVIVSGLQKIQPGASVSVDNNITQTSQSGS